MTPHTIAQQARQRILAAPCQCKNCVIADNLPAVQRILKAHHEKSIASSNQTSAQAGRTNADTGSSARAFMP